MNWEDIKVSSDSTYFLFEGKHLFEKRFIEVLKFHAPGLAPVKDESGSFHIDCWGQALYPDRYTRTFGYYFNRAAVVENGKWFHLTEEGKRAYHEDYAWTGNYQEGLCPVRDHSHKYFHIDLQGRKVYTHNFSYAGDYKDGIACVKTMDGYFRHIDTKGNFIHHGKFVDLGVFHKNFATAKDENGWHHIDKNGCELYHLRYHAVEPFYNGQSLVTQFDGEKLVIDESGTKLLAV
ncbi:MAG: WG repeat-containing protein [Imperialibacter sp.]